MDFVGKLGDFGENTTIETEPRMRSASTDFSDTARTRVRPPLTRLEVIPLQSSNPAFSNTFVQNLTFAETRSRTMTVEGTAIKALVLLAVMMATFTLAWNLTETGRMSYGVITGSSIAGFIVAMVICFKPTAAPLASPIYAALQGVALGGISRAFEDPRIGYPGIAVQAVALTGGVTFLMLLLYATRLIRVTGQLTSAILAATGAVCLLYVVSAVMSLFGGSMPFIHESGPIGIAFGVFVVGLAAFNLLLDFDFIEKGAEQHLSKNMEWYGAFALMLTLVWMYLQILDLLRKINSRD